MYALLRIAALIVLILLIPFICWVFFVSFTKRESSMWFGARPSTLGVTDGKLAGPKRTPNSVVSEGIVASHPAYIAPIAFAGDPREAMAKLLTVLQAMPDVTIVTANETYVYCEFRTPKMRYTDDLEARIDEASSVIHIRSASRIGKRDFDVNRKRVETIRGLLDRKSVV